MKKKKMTPHERAVKANKAWQKKYKGKLSEMMTKAANVRWKKNEVSMP